MLRRSPAIVWSQLDLPRPLQPDHVVGLMRRLAADRAAPPMLFEVRADAAGTTHLVGTPVEHVRWAQRTMRDLLPGVEVEGVSEPGARLPVMRAVRLRIRPRDLALAIDRPELTSTALLSALHAKLEPGETLVVQVVLGRRLAPRHLPQQVPDPTQPWWQLMAHGVGNAPTPVRQQIDARSGEHGFAACLRIGVAAETSERRQQLVIGVLGALSTAQHRGIYLDLNREPPQRLNCGLTSTRLPLRLAVSELVGLLAWPLGDGELPGLPPLHPKRLRVPAAVTSSTRIFGTAAVRPGAPAARPVGVAASDALGHLIALGPTGSGKSTALLHLIAADIDAGRPVLVIDPKRQLIDDILDRAIPEHRMNDVVIIDPADATSPHGVVGFNPLDVSGRDPDVVVDGLLAVLAAVFRDGWGPRTQDVINSGLLTLARANASHGAQSRNTIFTLLDLPRLLTDAAFRTSVIGPVADDPGLGSFWAWYQSLNPAAQAQAVAAPLNKLRQYLLRPSLRAILGQPEPKLRLRDLFIGNKVVLVPLNEGLIGPVTAQLLGSLIVAETWSATLERANEPNPGARPGMVYVDEVQQYLHLPTSIGDALARSRSLGVGWHLAHQFRDQLPRELRAAVDSNAKSKLVFRLNDPDDARDLAKQAPELDAVDFLSLPAFHAYANLTTNGTPAGWSLIQTLPPPALTGLGDEVRAASRARYAQPATEVADQQQGRRPKDGAVDQTVRAASEEPAPAIPIGRKRRPS